jgi:2-keto-4-pentenoate hydratase/2-oxohepta-3-ene-1,7-dioic acid hydratase in catechol pathway
MKLVRFQSSAGPRLGFLDGDSIVDPSYRNDPVFADTLAFIQSGERGRGLAAQAIKEAPASARVPLNQAKLLAPLVPSTILCSGSNYTDHNAEKSNTPISGKEPEFFVKTADSVIGPGEPIVHDERLSKKIDCETELAVVIGKAGRFIPVERALDHVFGYTIVNDVTARDRQVRQKDGVTWYELGRGKAFDTSAPLGPCIVTSDEIGDPQNLKLMTRINGELRQSSNTSRMIWSCAQLVHFFSTNFTLKPGMVIITGTPSGTAWSVDKELGGKYTPQPGMVAATRYCLPGDVVESEIEGIGILRNPMKAYAA